MTEAAQNIVEFPSVDNNEIDEIAGDIAASKKALIRSGGRGGKGTTGITAADVLPPDGVIRYDDLCNAERFLESVGSDLLFCTERKQWLVWAGTHWTWDNTNFVFDMITEFAKSLYSPENVTGSKEAMLHAIRSNNRAGLNAILDISQRKQSVSIDSFDNIPYAINCLNGTLELKTGNLRPHDRNDRITRIVNCNYDADAKSNTFDNFLTRIQPDASIRAFLQRSIGYSLLGNVRERSFWILYGTGNNGKSVFTNLFVNLLGEYASTTTAASIMAGKQSSIPNDIARLKGKRFVVVPETGENERLNEPLIKALSAGDTVTARFLFGEFFDFGFSGKIWIATNHLPTITDHSKGFWDRLKLIPFTEDIPANEVRKIDDLLADLMADASAVLNWAVLGSRDYFDLDNLDVPKVIQDEINAYRREQDSIAQFIEERCETVEQARNGEADGLAAFAFSPADYKVKNGDLYSAYVAFCKENGEYQRSQRRLSQNMKERGFKQQNSGGRSWEGVRLLKTE